MLRAMGILELVTPPASEPVTVDEVKAHARIEVTADDDLLGTYITAARQLAEKTTGRAFITQTWKLVLDAWPGCADEWWDGMREMPISALEGDAVDIRKSPFLAITTVQTVDEDGTLTTWASSNYYSALAAGGFARLVKRSGSTWPAMASPVRQVGGILVTFTAGYGIGASSVPMAIRQAIKMTVAHWYENRETVGQSMNELPMGARALLQQYMVAR